MSGGYSERYEEHGRAPLSLHITPQTVIVTRGEDWTEESFAALRAAIREDVVLIHLAGDETIEALDEAAMREAGWVRA